MKFDSKMSRAELIEEHDVNWRGFEATLKSMPEADQVAYIRAQGYGRVQDLVAHMLEWNHATIERVNDILAGKSNLPKYDVDEFNARAVEKHSERPEQDVWASYEESCEEMSHLLESLLESALENDDIYEWCYLTAIDHYQEHSPTKD